MPNVWEKKHVWKLGGCPLARLCAHTPLCPPAPFCIPARSCFYLCSGWSLCSLFSLLPFLYTLSLLLTLTLLLTLPLLYTLPLLICAFNNHLYLRSRFSLRSRSSLHSRFYLSLVQALYPFYVILRNILPLKKPVGYITQVPLAQYSFRREMEAFVVAHLAQITEEVTKGIIMMATVSTLWRHGGPRYTSSRVKSFQIWISVTECCLNQLISVNTTYFLYIRKFVQG